MAGLHVTAALLRSYLDQIAARGFRLGEVDCCTLMADWLMQLGLPDAMADRRGTYATEREFRRMLMAEGGMIAACHRRFTDAGLKIAAVARAGDVAVVMLPFARGRGGALRYRATGAVALSASHFVVIGRRQLCAFGTMAVAKIWTVDG